MFRYMLIILCISVLCVSGVVFSANAQIPKFCEGLAKARDSAEKRCVCTDDLGMREFFFNDVYRIESKLESDFEGQCQELVTEFESLCGGMMNIKETYIEISPDPEVGCPPNWSCSTGTYSTENPGVSITLQAEIFGLIADRKCCNSGGKDCPLTSGKLKDDVSWYSDNPDVATVDRQFDDMALITVRGVGEANILATSVFVSRDIKDSVKITVGLKKADIAFVVSTTMEHWCNFPGDGCNDPGPLLPDRASAFYERTKNLFVDDFRLGVFSYAVHPSFCTDLSFCGIPSAECYTSRQHGWPEMTTEFEFVSAFGELRTVCGNSAYYTSCPAGASCYYGVSMYSGLMQAINSFNWRADAVKAIILIGGNPACIYYYPGIYCDVEPVTEISRGDVIESASAKGIKIFAINTVASRECLGSTLYTDSARAELSTLSSATGGRYYPSNILSTWCYPSDWENVLTAFEDIHNLAGSP